MRTQSLTHGPSIRGEGIWVSHLHTWTSQQVEHHAIGQLCKKAGTCCLGLHSRDVSRSTNSMTKSANKINHRECKHTRVWGCERLGTDRKCLCATSSDATLASLSPTPTFSANGKFKKKMNPSFECSLPTVKFHTGHYECKSSEKSLWLTTLWPRD